MLCSTLNSLFALGVYILVHKYGKFINIAQTRQIQFGRISHSPDWLRANRLPFDSANDQSATGRFSHQIGPQSVDRLPFWLGLPIRLPAGQPAPSRLTLNGVFSRSHVGQVGMRLTLSLSAPTDPNYALPIRRTSFPNTSYHMNLYTIQFLCILLLILHDGTLRSYAYY